MAKRPRSVKVDPFRARVIRGPRDGLWYWRAERFDRDEGRDLTIWTGWASREEVRKLLAKRVAEGREAPARVALVDCRTVDDLLGFWMGEQEARGELPAGHRDRLAPESVRKYRHTVERLRERIGKTAIDRLAQRDIQRMMREDLEAGLGDYTVRARLRTFGAVWRWGLQVGLHDRRPLETELLVEAERKNVRHVPTADQVRRVLRHLEGWPADALRLMWSWGCRIGEVAAIRVHDVDFTSRLVTLSGKTGTRRVPMDDATELVLRRLVAGREASDRIWPVAFSTLKARWTTDHIPRACAKAGVPRFTQLGLRSAAISRVARSGVPLTTAAKLFGVSVKVMERHYLEVDAGDLHAAIARAQLSSLEPRGGEGNVYQLRAGAASDGDAGDQ